MSRSVGVYNEMRYQKGAPKRHRDDLTGSRVLGVPLGAVLGALGAVAFAGWEAALLGRVGLELPDRALGEQVLAVYAGTGAVCGALAGLSGMRGARWAMLTVAIGVGWLLSPAIGASFHDAGGTVWYGPLIALPVAAALGWLVAQVVPSGAIVLGLATVTFVFSALAVPANLHLLGQVFSSGALTVDLVLALVAVAFGGVAAALGGDGGSPRVAAGLVALGAIGWGVAYEPLVRPDPAPPLATRGGPPVVLLVVDGLRADHVGAYGYGRPTTPNLDRFAQRAVVFTDASSTAPWALPAVASLLTGRTPSDHGAGVNPGDGNALTALRAGVPALTTALAEAGWVGQGEVTNPWVGAAFGLGRGFAAYDDRIGPAALPVAIRPLLVLWLDPIAFPEYRRAAQLTDEALAFVAAQPKSGWFLMVHYMDLHGRPDDADVAALGASTTWTVDAYDANLRAIDRAIGRLLDGLPAGAWVVVTGSNGVELLEDRRVPNAPARYGHSLFEEQLRVPLIVDGPGVGAARVTRPVSHVDVAPTLLFALGLEVPRNTRGFVMPELVRGGKPVPADRPILAEALRFGPEQQSARVGTDKIIVHRNGAVYLYDLAKDPLERAPTGGAEGGELATARRLRALLPPIGAADLKESVPVGAELADLFKRLRYEPTSAAPGSSPSPAPPSP